MNRYAHATSAPDPFFKLGDYPEGRSACADPTIKTIQLLVESVDFDTGGVNYTCDFRTNPSFPATGVLIPIDLAY